MVAKGGPDNFASICGGANDLSSISPPKAETRARRRSLTFPNDSSSVSSPKIETQHDKSSLKNEGTRSSLPKSEMSSGAIDPSSSSTVSVEVKARRSSLRGDSRTQTLPNDLNHMRRSSMPVATLQSEISSGANDPSSSTVAVEVKARRSSLRGDVRSQTEPAQNHMRRSSMPVGPERNNTRRNSLAIPQPGQESSTSKSSNSPSSDIANPVMPGMGPIPHLPVVLPEGYAARYNEARRSTTVSVQDHPSSRPANDHGISSLEASPERTMSGNFINELAEEAKLNKQTGRISYHDQKIIKNRRKEEEAQQTKAAAEAAAKNKGLVKLRGQCRKIIDHTAFDFLMGVFVATNAICMCLEYELTSSQGLAVVGAVDHMFLTIFVLELGVRLFVYRLAFAKEPSGVLDVFVVVSSVATQWLLPLVVAGQDFEEAKTLQVLRVLRVVRCVRILRMLTMFKDLWIIVMSFFGCIGTLIWTVFFMIIVIFIFGMFGVELIGEGPEFDGTQVQERFRRPVPAMLTLFQIMSLDDWMVDIVRPLLKTAQWTYIYILLFIGIGPFALMNLVTAVVVESSVKRVREDKEYQKQLYEGKVANRSVEISDFWHALAQRTDESGEVHESEIMDLEDFLALAASHPFLQKEMSKFGMTDPEDFALLFDCLDVDESESLELNEVIRGVLKLQHLAEDRDTISLIQAGKNPLERRRMFAQLLVGAVEDSGTMLYIVEKTVEKIDAKIVSYMSVNDGRGGLLSPLGGLDRSISSSSSASADDGEVVSPGVVDFKTSCISLDEETSAQNIDKQLETSRGSVLRLSTSIQLVEDEPQSTFEAFKDQSSAPTKPQSEDFTKEWHKMEATLEQQSVEKKDLQDEESLPAPSELLAAFNSEEESLPNCMPSAIFAALNEEDETDNAEKNEVVLQNSRSLPPLDRQTLDIPLFGSNPDEPLKKASSFVRLEPLQLPSRSSSKEWPQPLQLPSKSSSKDTNWRSFPPLPGQQPAQFSSCSSFPSPVGDPLDGVVRHPEEEATLDNQPETKLEKGETLHTAEAALEQQEESKLEQIRREETIMSSSNQLEYIPLDICIKEACELQQAHEERLQAILSESNEDWLKEWRKELKLIESSVT